VFVSGVKVSSGRNRTMVQGASVARRLQRRCQKSCRDVVALKPRERERRVGRVGTSCRVSCRTRMTTTTRRSDTVRSTRSSHRSAAPSCVSQPPSPPQPTPTDRQTRSLALRGGGRDKSDRINVTYVFGSMCGEILSRMLSRPLL